MMKASVETHSMEITQMSFASLKITAAAALTALVLAAPAQALTLNTAGLKANANLTFGATAIANAKAATVQLSEFANTSRLADVDGTLANGKVVKVPVYQFPITKADVSVTWQLKVKPNYGISNHAGLRMISDGGDVMLANFKVDYNAKIMSADVYDVFRKEVIATGMPLYTFDQTKADVISLKGLVLNMTNQIGNLKFTPVAVDNLSAGLGLDPVLATALSQLDWGKLDVKVTSYARKPKVNDAPLTLADMPKSVYADVVTE